ncbi:hypothetical protein QP938_07995 [Porticoccaceae bacterium LTM1]|nr:hypothetical protein QP938_07995 [Porticoccaceae bacterium LTM1]
MSKVVAFIVYSLLWLWNVASILFLALFLGFLISIVIDDFNPLVFRVLGALGLFAGILWAEKVRKKDGLSKFHGRVNAHPEVDGPTPRNGRW